jgi:hypothetical protein
LFIDEIVAGLRDIPMLVRQRLATSDAFRPSSDRVRRARSIHGGRK